MKEKDKYPLWIRIFFGVPAVIFVSLIMIVLVVYSTKSIGRAMKETGENLLKQSD